MKTFILTDTTLAAMERGAQKHSFRETLQTTALLAKTGADRIVIPSICVAAGASVKEESIVKRTVAETLPEGVAAAMNADSKESIDIAWDCVKNAKTPALRVVLPISTVQMEYMYHKKAAVMLETIAEVCAYAKTLCEDVELVMADASRAEQGFAAKCALTAKENGATAVTFCDDGGVYFAEKMAEAVKELRLVCGDGTRIYIQPSNALGMAYASIYAAAVAGADGVICAAGQETKDYADIACFADLYRAKGEAMGITSKVDVTAIHRVADRIAAFTAGAKAELTSVSATEAPTATENEATFSKGADMTEIANAVAALGYTLSETDIGAVYEEFHRVAAKKEQIGMRELEAIVASTAMQVPSTYHLESYVVNSGTCLTATATVVLRRGDEILNGVSLGDGPIDAVFHAIEQIIGHHYELDDFRISAVTKGREAVGSSLIRLRKDGRLYAGNGVSTDIIGACVRAYINALNKIIYEEN